MSMKGSGVKAIIKSYVSPQPEEEYNVSKAIIASTMSRDYQLKLILDDDSDKQNQL